MRRYVGLLIVLVFFSCGPKEETVLIPDDILNVEDMISMTVEINLIKAAHNTRLVNVSEKEDEINSYYKSLFKEKGITQKTYSDSYDWYTKHKDLFIEIYNGVVEELSKRHARAMLEVTKARD